jgi:hypothetical protein
MNEVDIDEYTYILDQRCSGHGDRCGWRRGAGGHAKASTTPRECHVVFFSFWIRTQRLVHRLGQQVLHLDDGPDRRQCKFGSITKYELLSHR